MLPLTNAHTHLELSALARLCPSAPVSFVPWIRSVFWERRWLSKAQIRTGIENSIAALENYGTTHIGDITATGLSIEPLFKSHLKGIIFLEILGLNGKKALDLLEQKKEEIRKNRRRPGYGDLQIGLSLHAPYSCHPDLLRDGAQWCRKEEVPLCLHAAESPEETEYLLTGKIPNLSGLDRFVGKLFGFRTSSFPGLPSIPYLASLGVLAAKPFLVHSVQVIDQDIQLIAESGCAVIHCPRSNHLLSCGRMPLEQFLAAHVPVYLGSDSLASCPSLDIRQELEFARSFHADRVEGKRFEELIHQAI
ncbi:MAG: amidohydrolase family protein [Pseudomonadota bacterium]